MHVARKLDFDIRANDAHAPAAPLRSRDSSLLVAISRLFLGVRVCGFYIPFFNPGPAPRLWRPLSRPTYFVVTAQVPK